MGNRWSPKFIVRRTERERERRGSKDLIAAWAQLCSAPVKLRTVKRKTGKRLLFIRDLVLMQSGRQGEIKRKRIINFPPSMHVFVCQSWSKWKWKCKFAQNLNIQTPRVVHAWLVQYAHAPSPSLPPSPTLKMRFSRYKSVNGALEDLFT